MTSLWSLSTNTRAKWLVSSQATMAIGMKWVRLQVAFIAALALLVANCQCLVACSTKPCHELLGGSEAKSHHPLSPCHEHQHESSKQNKADGHCAHVTLLSEKTKSALDGINLSQATPLAFLPIRNVSLLLSYVPERQVRYETSPPRPPELVFSTVLII
jgi:hypothetical protein